jgi:hypothetical protein
MISDYETIERVFEGIRHINPRTLTVVPKVIVEGLC